MKETQLLRGLHKAKMRRYAEGTQFVRENTNRPAAPAGWMQQQTVNDANASIRDYNSGPGVGPVAQTPASAPAPSLVANPAQAAPVDTRGLLQRRLDTATQIGNYAEGTPFVRENTNRPAAPPGWMEQQAVNDANRSVQEYNAGAGVGGTTSAPVPAPAPAPSLMAAPAQAAPTTLRSAIQTRDAATKAAANYAKGTRRVHGKAGRDKVPAMLTKGEAVLTPGAADAIGRHNIAAANAAHAPKPVGLHAAMRMPSSPQHYAEGASFTQKVGNGLQSVNNWGGRALDTVKGWMPGSGTATPAASASPASSGAASANAYAPEAPNVNYRPNIPSVGGAPTTPAAPATNPLSGGTRLGNIYGGLAAAAHGIEAGNAFNAGDPYKLAGETVMTGLNAFPPTRLAGVTADIAGGANSLLTGGDTAGGLIGRGLRSADETMAGWGNERAKNRLSMAAASAPPEPPNAAGNHITLDEINAARTAQGKGTPLTPEQFAQTRLGAGPSTEGGVTTIEGSGGMPVQKFTGAGAAADAERARAIAESKAGYAGRTLNDAAGPSPEDRETMAQASDLQTLRRNGWALPAGQTDKTGLTALIQQGMATGRARMGQVMADRRRRDLGMAVQAQRMQNEYDMNRLRLNHEMMNENQLRNEGIIRQANGEYDDKGNLIEKGKKGNDAVRTINAALASTAKDHGHTSIRTLPSPYLHQLLQQYAIHKDNEPSAIQNIGGWVTANKPAYNPYNMVEDQATGNNGPLITRGRAGRNFLNSGASLLPWKTNDSGAMDETDRQIKNATLMSGVR